MITDKRRQEATVAAPVTTMAGDGAGKPSPAELRAEIEQTREELGQTVEALSAKLDVKTRTKERVGLLAEQAKHRASQARAKAVQITAAARETASTNSDVLQIVVPVGVSMATVTVVGVFVRRRRHR